MVSFFQNFSFSCQEIKSQPFSTFSTSFLKELIISNELALSEKYDFSLKNQTSFRKAWKPPPSIAFLFYLGYPSSEKVRWNIVARMRFSNTMDRWLQRKHLVYNVLEIQNHIPPKIPLRFLQSWSHLTILHLIQYPTHWNTKFLFVKCFLFWFWVPIRWAKIW